MTAFHERFRTLAAQHPAHDALDDDTVRITYGELPELLERYRACLRHPRKIIILNRMPRNSDGTILRGEIVAAHREPASP